jgi:phosphoglycolate phosphatase-like HAD superfamily hydrolase
MRAATGTALVVWDVDGTLIRADLRWLRRAIARTYDLDETAVVFPEARVHGFTDESIVTGAASASGIGSAAAVRGVGRFRHELARVMAEGEAELARVQPPYPGAAETISALHDLGVVQTVLTGNLRFAAEVKLRVSGLARHLDLDIGAFGSDAVERFDLPAVVIDRFAARFGSPLDPRRTVVIGDAPNDIACARHAGFHVIAVAHRLDAGELARQSPDAVLQRLSPDEVTTTVTSLVNCGVR